MFCNRYFGRRFFAARYWPKVGAGGAPEPPPDPVSSRRRRMIAHGRTKA